MKTFYMSVVQQSENTYHEGTKHLEMVTIVI